MTRAVAVVPLRGGGGSKTRLASVLGPDERAALVATLARHVVATLAAADGVAGVLVVVPAADDGADAAAVVPVPAGMRAPVRVLVQPADRPGLDAAVELGRAAVARYGDQPGGPGEPPGVVGAEEAVPRRPRLLVVHGDLPALAVDDVAALLAGRSPLTLATDRTGTGTNALVLDPASVPFPFRFGPGSLAAHRAEAERLGWQATVVRRPGTAVDLDTPDDWAALPADVRARLRREVPGLATLAAAR